MNVVPCLTEDHGAVLKSDNTPPGRQYRHRCRSSSTPDTSEGNLKKVGLWEQGRDYCRLTAVGSG